MNGSRDTIDATDGERRRKYEGSELLGMTGINHGTKYPKRIDGSIDGYRYITRNGKKMNGTSRLVNSITDMTTQWHGGRLRRRVGGTGAGSGGGEREAGT